MRDCRSLTPLVAVILFSLILSPGARAGTQEIAGAWQAETYVLKDGVRHPVDGLLFFTGRDWSVVFFVLDDEGTPQRGSAEGGTYTLEGDRLVLTHRYNLSGGKALQGLPASDWRLQVSGPQEATTEPTRIERVGGRLTLHFPSGNRMEFNKSS